MIAHPRAPGLAFLLGVLCTALALAAGAADVRDTQAHVFPHPDPARPIVLAVTVGEIAVEAWDRPEVAVEIVRRAPDAEALSRLPVVVSDEVGRLEVRAEQVEEGRNPRISATLRVRAPGEAIVEHAGVFEGDLSVRRLRGSIRASVGRGSIVGDDLSGRIRFETSIGSISLQRAHLVPGGVIRCRAFNGDVRISLVEQPTDARILALTLNGTIDSSIPLTERSGFGPRFAETTLGRGEPVLSVDVVTGDIAIRTPDRPRR